MAIATPAASTWSLLPQPADVRPAPVRRGEDRGRRTVAVRGADRQAVQPIADRFMQLVADTRGLQLHAATAADAHPAITFDVDPDASVVGDTGYRIVVAAQEIRVVARSPAGAFYGSVTLWQLLTPPGWTRGTAAEIAEGVIDDHPRFAWRALLLDSGRHFQSVADIKKLIDWMSLDKLNVLLWHLTEDQGWRLEIPKYPNLTKTGACRKAVGLDERADRRSRQTLLRLLYRRRGARHRALCRRLASSPSCRKSTFPATRRRRWPRIRGLASPAKTRACGRTGESVPGCSNRTRRPCSSSMTCSMR